MSRPPLAAALLAVLCAGRLAAAPAPAFELGAEADRWLAASRAAKADANLDGARREAEALLERAKADQAAGRTALAFEELARGRGLLRAFAERDRYPAAANDMKEFERVWSERSRALSAEARELAAAPWSGASGAVRAIGESAQGKIVTLVEASRAYAAVTSPGDGIFYLGQADAAAELARMSRTLHGSAPARPARWRSVRHELDALQQRVNAAFQPPRSIERHADFIRLNATLKLADELDDAGLFAGALYQYLDAVQQLALLDPPATPAAPDLVVARARLAAAGEDTTLGVLFLERAEAIAAAAADGAKPGDPRAAQVIAEIVLPAYLATLDRIETLASSKEQAASVTVTLVRWPYT